MAIITIVSFGSGIWYFVIVKSAAIGLPWFNVCFELSHPCQMSSVEVVLVSTESIQFTSFKKVTIVCKYFGYSFMPSLDIYVSFRRM